MASFSYDPESGSSKDLIRLLIGDTDEADERNQIFQDEELEAFLSMESNTVKLAAAQALDTMASQEAMIQKKIKILDLTTDGPAVAKELRDRAQELRAEVYSGDMDLPDTAELVVDQFTYAQRIRNQQLREGP